MRLSDLQTGERAVIVKVLGHGGFRKRIIEMGFIKGKTVEVLLNAPLKDPIKYRVLGYDISLRREEAKMIEVVSEKEARELLFDKPKTIEELYENIEVAEDKLRNIALDKRRTINVALVGNPNCGKTSLFNIASGAHEKVGNYGGVTVDSKEGYFDFEGYRFRIVDLPGTYSLSAYTPEEVYVRKHIVEETPDIIINVVDATNLERNLYLTTQLIDMNVRMVIALNMYDELENSKSELDHITLSKMLGVPMIPTVCTKNKGIDDLFHIIINMYEGADFLDKDGNIDPEILKEIKEWHHQHVDEAKHTEHIEDYTSAGSGDVRKVFRHIHINHGRTIEKAINYIKEELAKNKEMQSSYCFRFLAIKLLENDAEVQRIIEPLPNSEEIFDRQAKMVQKIASIYNESAESAITDAKYAFIDGALRQTYKESHREQRKTTKIIDSIVTHKFWGFPIFFLFMYITFMGTFVLGEYPMEGIEWLVNQLGELVQRNMSDGPLKGLIVDGIISGVGGVIVFLPNILILYFFISLMEDSGYMARAAFIMDKVMHKMGLHGKSFIPLLMGFGCNVPAIMATRTIENRKTRLITMLVNPLMSCSARLPIYLVLIGTFFPKNAGLMLLLVYGFGILLAVVMAKIFSKAFKKGNNTPFVMELPPYRMPTGKSVLRQTWEKGVVYLKKMGGIILIATVFIWFLGYYPQGDETMTVQEQQENSYIGKIGKAIEPAIKPLGFDWKLGVGLLSGLGAKELVVSTLGVLYAGDGESTNIGNKLAENGVTPLIAFCYMIFTLIYLPCVAVLVAIKNESGGWKWAIFTALYTTGLAWLVSFVFYRIGMLFL
ncbi:MAG: ferrous iron transport protein B [Bacteroidales bacterium]|nr:ferrous iron transport protein B [Bacteroidales bacterium]